MKRNVRLVLPGEYVLDKLHERPHKVHHVEVSGHPPEVAVCLSPGPHPDRETDKTAAWPIMWRGINDEVEVVPPPPTVRTRWDGQQWLVEAD